VAFAKHELALATKVGENGATRKEHFEKLKRGGYAVPELENAPELPERLSYLWAAYLSMINSGWPLGFEEVRAWSDMTGAALLGWELTAIVSVENARKEIHG